MILLLLNYCYLNSFSRGWSGIAPSQLFFKKTNVLEQLYKAYKVELSYKITYKCTFGTEVNNCLAKLNEVKEAIPPTKKKSKGDLKKKMKISKSIYVTQLY